MDALDRAVVGFRAAVLRKAGIHRFRTSHLRGNPRDVYDWARGQHPGRSIRRRPPSLEEETRDGIPGSWYRRADSGAPSVTHDQQARRALGTPTRRGPMRRWKYRALQTGAAVLIVGVLAAMVVGVLWLVT